MGNGSVDNERRQSAVALACLDGAFSAVELRRQGAGYEVLWAKRQGPGEGRWESFGGECGLPTVVAPEDENRRKVVLGYDGASVAFYRMKMPAVSGGEMDTIVRVQAEARLPLPSDQMEMVWRKGLAADGEVAVTMAAARRAQLTEFVAKVQSLQPDVILLDSEAVVRAWQVLFGTNQRTAMVLNVQADSAVACLVEDGRLSNTAVLDMGLSRFATWTQLDESAIEAERFVQDLWSVIGLFGYTGAEALPIVVLSDGSNGYETVAECLRQGGLDASTVEPADGVLTGQPLSREDVFACRVALGLSLMALDRRDAGLNLFAGVYRRKEQEKKQPLLLSMRLTGAVAALMLVVFLVVSYAIDLRSPAALTERMTAVAGETDVAELEKQQEVLRLVAQLRPDVLELMTEINASGPRGIVLDSVSFKRGSPVTVAGLAQSNDQIYAFQKALRDKKTLFSDVEIQSTTTTRSEGQSAGDRGGSDDRGGPGGPGGPGGSGGPGGPGGSSSRGGGQKIKFTIGLKYKKFCDKK